ncbi:IS701 family transposase [Streptomyces alkaliphilus]|uniref:IS701 family transposase n=1 Tax=Streptomyces alkaliphilus TaxID=1472722 RepID=UPI00117F20F8|nr:transposase [Streptomyces alkaliphilus]MQS06059.1 transcriptional regulator [Streptomyces alkaliphilus]
MVTHALRSAPSSVPVFAEQLFGPLPRADQRRWAEVYLQSLLTTPGKKSVRRLAATVSDSPTASQSLHQFINASPWDWMPVRRELTHWVEQRLTPRAWVVDLAVMRKRGEHSCGVHRRFVPSTGRSVTCQVGIGAFLAAPGAAVPVDWRLLLSGPWTRDAALRTRARIPEHVGPRTIEQHVLSLVDALTGVSRHPSVPIVADLSTTPGAPALIRGLALRNRDFVVAVPDGITISLGHHLRVHHRHSAGHRAPTLTGRSLFTGEPDDRTRIVTVPPAPGRARSLTVLTGIVHLPEASAGGSAPRTYRMLATHPGAGRSPSRLWLTNLTHARMADLVELTRLFSGTAGSMREMERDFGLLDFEGRSYPGWHHHMTLTSAAHAFSHLHHRGVPQERALVSA